MKRLYEQLAKDCWSMIQALGSTQHGERQEEIDAAAKRLIEMACESAAESVLITIGYPPRGAK